MARASGLAAVVLCFLTPTIAWGAPQTTAAKGSNILKGSAEGSVVGPRQPGDFAFTHVTIATTGLYRTSPAQGRPADGRLSAGTRVRLISENGSFAKIALDNGMEF